MKSISLKCECGQVTGQVVNVSASNGNRVVCCCSDCQTFVNHLGHPQVLDKFGGTDLYQTTLSQVKIEQGIEQLRCLKLSPKGPTRWYTACCNSPIGNTINGKMPFIGLVHSFTDNSLTRDQDFGPVLAYVQTQHALSEPNYPRHHPKFPFSITLRIIRNMLVWKIKGLNKPTPFYDDASKPIVNPSFVDS